MVWINSTIWPTCSAELDRAEMVTSASLAELVALRASSADDAAWRLISPIDIANSSLAAAAAVAPALASRSEEHTSELQSLMRISYAVFCLKKQRCSRLNDTLSSI